MLFIVAGALAALSLLFPLACRLWPALAQGWLEAVFAPAAGALAVLSAKCPFPLAEPLLLLTAALLVLLLFRCRRGACLLLAVLLAGYALLWAPAYSLPARYAVEENADAAALAAVCDGLIECLNACEGFALSADLAARALEAARLAETPAPISAAPKPARYPEWMRAFSLAGLYVPWTAEALYEPTAPAAAQPFTAVHELMHAGGVADEGQANICAYVACHRYGGAFAYSADLWALKYAAEALRALDAESCAACLSALDADVWRDLSALGLSNARPASVIAEKTGDYGALAAWLAGASYESIEKRAH